MIKQLQMPEGVFPAIINLSTKVFVNYEYI